MANSLLNITVYSKERLLASNRKKIVSCLKELGIPSELIICDNGSTDRTREIGTCIDRAFPEKAINIYKRLLLLIKAQVKSI